MSVERGRFTHCNVEFQSLRNHYSTRQLFKLNFVEEYFLDNLFDAATRLHLKFKTRQTRVRSGV